MGLTARELRYGPARSQVVEVTLPAEPGPLPVCVLVHGGWWRPRYTRKLMRPLADDLVACGWAAWNVEYRRIGRLSGGGWPRSCEDVDAAIDLLAAHAEAMDADDECVPADLAEGYAEAARVAGDDVTLDVRAHEGHFEHNDPASEAWAWMGIGDVAPRPGTETGPVRAAP